LLILDIAIALAVFGVLLAALTYFSALLADITGHFPLLFIHKPQRQLFRLLRWVVAAAVTAGILAAME